MSWKDSVNSAMYRATGYVITRETPKQRREAIRTASKRAAARARERTAEKCRREAAEREEALKASAEKRREEEAAKLAARLRRAEQRGARTEAKRRREKGRRREEGPTLRAARGLRASYDDELRKTVERVVPRTMTGATKIATLIEATRYVVRHRVPGDVVECGVWRGGSMQAVALTLLSLGETDRELHLFDTFEGMPPPTENDTRTTEAGSVSAEDLLAESDKNSNMWAIASLGEVQEAMAATGYPVDKVHFHQGLVEDTTPGQAPDTIAILRLDTDWYNSTRHELEVLYDRLSPGGALILDDYGDWDGARKAVNEWLAKTDEPLFLAPMGSGRIAIKPPADRRVAEGHDDARGKPVHVEQQGEGPRVDHR